MSYTVCVDDDKLPPEIRPIEVESIRRIVAGQAVTDLATAVKELVDNSLDANSKSIKIRLFNQGIDFVEVSDDGCGVPKASRRFMATLHATNKISSFEDIYQDTRLTTMGFRGEALFCLANLSDKLTISTKTANETLCEKMEFKKDGTLDVPSISKVRGKVGTNVSVTNLLGSLPVRRKDFIRRIKFHKAKMLRMMEGYAIFGVGVRISVIDVVKSANHSNRENILLATSSSTNSIEGNISSVMGSRFFAELAKIKVDLSSDQTTTTTNKNNSNGNNEHCMQPEVNGFVSSALCPQDLPFRGILGGGNQNRGFKKGGTQRVRSAQFFSINGRPVELPQISRTLNDAWRPFARGTSAGKKRPSCVLCFSLPNSAYDINLSPEKRQVLLMNSSDILQHIHEAVTKIWASETNGKFIPNELSVPVENRMTMKDFGLGNTDDNNVSQYTTTSENSRKRQQSDSGTMIQNDHLLSQNSVKKRRQSKIKVSPLNIFKNDQGDGHKSKPILETSSEIDEKNDLLQEQKSDTTEAPSRNLKEDAMTENIADDISTTTSSSVGNENEHPSKTTKLSTNNKSQNESYNEKSMNEKQSIPTDEFNNDSFELKIPSSMRTKKESSTSIMSDSDLTPSQKNYKRSQYELNEISPMYESNVEKYKQVEEQEQLSQGQQDLPNHGANDKEKLNWIEVQSRFNKVDDDTCDEVEYCQTNNTLDLDRFSLNRVSNNSTIIPSQSVKKESLRLRSNLGFEVKGNVKSPCAESKSANSIESAESYLINGPLSDDRATNSPQALMGQHIKEEPPMSSQDSDLTIELGTTWESFKSTKDILLLSRQAQKEKLKRRRKFKQNAPQNVKMKGDSYKTDYALQSTAIADSQNSTINLSKKDFAGMTVIGQFNLGFILAKCQNNHLWILDQHACEERSNFEDLMKNTIIREQKLIAPMPMELSPADESCVLDHIDVFEKNGFRFKYDPDKPPRHRLSLTALPHSGACNGRKAVQYNQEDVTSLCNILGASDGRCSSAQLGGGTGVDGSGISGNNAVRRYAGGSDNKIINRLPKTVAMFASRACRSSVMIGDPLSRKKMKQIVMELDGVDNPWSCAHGRPTMCHVGNLQSMFFQEMQADTKHVASAAESLRNDMIDENVIDI